MGLRLLDGRGADGPGPSGAELSLVEGCDAALAAGFLLTLAACLVAAAVLPAVASVDMAVTSLLLSVPFLFAGIVAYLRAGRWYLFIAIAALTFLLWRFLALDGILLFFIDFTLVGTVGVVAVVSVLQKFMFYRVVRRVEYINVKERLSFWDRAVVFLFNIPPDLDTRNLTMDYNLKRASVPWGEIREMLLFGFTVGSVLWIYLSMNPAFETFEAMSHAPLYIFSLVLYIPVAVMPWAIFRSMDVRIETGRRDFKLYDGIKETLKRMAIPVFAASAFVLLAVGREGLSAVLAYIALSVGMNMLITALAAVVYFAFFEPAIVDAAVAKWKVFRPVPLLAGAGGPARPEAEYPCLPERDMDDLGELRFPD